MSNSCCFFLIWTQKVSQNLQTNTQILFIYFYERDYYSNYPCLIFIITKIQLPIVLQRDFGRGGESIKLYLLKAGYIFFLVVNFNIFDVLKRILSIIFVFVFWKMIIFVKKKTENYFRLFEHDQKFKIFLNKMNDKILNL